MELRFPATKEQGMQRIKQVNNKSKKKLPLIAQYKIKTIYKSTSHEKIPENSIFYRISSYCANDFCSLFIQRGNLKRNQIHY